MKKNNNSQKNVKQKEEQERTASEIINELNRANISHKRATKVTTRAISIFNVAISAYMSFTELPKIIGFLFCSTVIITMVNMNILEDHLARLNKAQVKLFYMVEFAFTFSMLISSALMGIEQLLLGCVFFLMVMALIADIMIIRIYDTFSGSNDKKK